MILLSHPTGNANVRNALLAFARANILNAFWTCVRWDAQSPFNRFLPGGLRAELSRRSYPREILLRTVCHPWREAGRLVAQRAGMHWLTRHERGAYSVDAVYRDLDSRVARALHRSTASTVYAYEDGAAETFRVANDLGIRTIYDLPIGYWRAARKIQQEEAARKPEWAATLPANLDSDEKLARKDDELKRAQRIIVPSHFVRRTLELAPDLSVPIDVIPFGAPALKPRENRRGHGRTLRALFVGSLTQRKGLSYLLDAVNALQPHIKLTLIGRPVKMCRPLEKALTQHRWIASAPHEQILKEMERHDVLIFPSLFEGQALVILEAMSRGMAVITTSNSGGADIIDPGRDGFIVPIRSAAAIQAKLEILLCDRARLEDVSFAAQCKAATFTWEKYGERLTRAVLERELAESA
ncbi:MAG TPA: glycosyltransferase family 4 protein [Planctomycetota bacterium]|nr:glycosyltransferase family 4 protein [Planctomycetota bacterium]